MIALHTLMTCSVIRQHALSLGRSAATTRLSPTKARGVGWCRHRLYCCNGRPLIISVENAHERTRRHVLTCHFVDSGSSVGVTATISRRARGRIGGPTPPIVGAQRRPFTSSPYKTALRLRQGGAAWPLANPMLSTSKAAFSTSALSRTTAAASTVHHQNGQGDANHLTRNHGTAAASGTDANAHVDEGGAQEGFEILFLGSDAFSIAVLEAIWKNREFPNKKNDDKAWSSRKESDSPAGCTENEKARGEEQEDVGGNVDGIEAGQARERTSHRRLEDKRQSPVKSLKRHSGDGHDGGAVARLSDAGSLTTTNSSAPRQLLLWRSIEVVVAPSLKPVGRGRGRRSSQIQEEDINDKGRTIALGEWAERKGLKVHVVPGGKMDEWELPDTFRARHPPSPSAPPRQLLITASFGHILPASLLAQFPHPAARLNVHPSRLPLLRGAAPIQWTIIQRRSETAVSVQSLAWKHQPGAEQVEGKGKAGGVDTGELWALREGLPVDPRDTHSTLLPRLATAAGDLVVDFLSKLHRAVFTPQTTFPQSCPQEHEARTRAPKITHARAHIAFTRHSAPRIDAWNRAAGHQHPAWFNFDHLGAGGEDQPAKNAVQIISAGLYSPGLHSATDLDDKLSKLEVGEALFGKAAAPLPSPPSGASDQVNYDQGTIADGVTDTASQHSRRLPREPRLLVRCAPDATLKSEATDINTAEAFLDIRRVKPAGRKEMDVRAWLDGVKETRGLKNYGVIKLQKDVGQGSNSTDV